MGRVLSRLNTRFAKPRRFGERIYIRTFSARILNFRKVIQDVFGSAPLYFSVFLMSKKGSGDLE